MNLLYQLLDNLPFEFIQFQFMKNALLAAMVVTPLFALLGTMAVNNKMAFFSDALGHSAFTGIAIGVLLGFKNPVLSMLAFGIVLSLMISKVKSMNAASTDTIISVFSSLSIAIGIVILSKNGGFAKYSSYLIGDILTVKTQELGTLFLVFLIVCCFWYVIYNRLLLISINPSLASSRGIHTAFIENIFVVLVAVAVMLSIKWIGILTINSLLILPAAAARNVSGNAKQYHILTLVISMVSGIGGIVASYYADTSAGATMVLIAGVLFFITLFLKKSVH